MIKKSSFLFLAVFGLMSLTSAQDIHFSQFFNTPLLLSPAQSGNFDGTYRAGIAYRSQWTSVNSPYKTFSVYYDHIFSTGLMPGDVVSASFVLYNDVAGDAKFSSLSMLLTGAYHKALGSTSRLTLGVQTGMLQKKLDVTQLKFADMFDGSGFSGSTNDNIGKASLSNLDLNVGLQYSTLVSDKISVYGGGTVYHLTRPKESFQNSSTRLNMRYSFHAGGSIILNDQMTVNPSLLFMTQAKASELILGSDVGYKLVTDKFTSVLYGGLWYRYKDAIIPYIGMDYKDFRLGLSYDVNVSSLSEVSRGRGGYEITLQYRGRITVAPTTIVVPCIRF